MAVMLRTAAELGALARSARRALGWTQEQAAHEAGVSRKFIISLEGGRHPNAELWRVLAVLSAVGVTLSASVCDRPQAPAASPASDSPAPHPGRPSVKPHPRSTLALRTTPGDTGEAEFDLDRHLATFSEDASSGEELAPHEPAVHERR